MIVYAQEEIPTGKPSVFLAGPTPRDKNVPSWRPEAIKLLEDKGFDIVIPEFRDGFVSGEFDQDQQIEWEDKALNQADIILFWIPRNLTDMLALTTNDEWGTWKTKAPEKLILGAPDNAKRVKYQRYYANKLGIQNFYTLEESCSAVIEKMKDLK